MQRSPSGATTGSASGGEIWSILFSLARNLLKMSRARKLLKLPYSPATSLRVDQQHCFLCGRSLFVNGRKADADDEHVVPDWLQKRYQLRDLDLGMQDGSSRRYNGLKVPCCTTCNRFDLKALEDKISRAHHAGYDGMATLPREELLLWVGKIFYAILFREGFLRRNVRDPRSATVFPRDALKSYRLIHASLQAVRFPYRFEPDIPGSVFVFRTLHGAPLDASFDLLTDLVTSTVGIRMGEVGIIACVTDGGTMQRDFADLYAHFSSQPLHPLQFLEVFCKTAYPLHLVKNWPTSTLYTPPLNSSSPYRLVTHLPAGGVRFHELDWEDYARLLHFHLASRELPSPSGDSTITLEDLYTGGSDVHSWLGPPNGAIPAMEWSLGPRLSVQP
jgi:hypothetical protein